MTKFSIDEIVYRTCKTVVQHVKNHVEEERGGIHSRFFLTYFIQSKILCVLANRQRSWLVHLFTRSILCLA